ncbi:MAG: DUF4115 domain-containing protein [Alphaproteobacteria bacterium]|nr:DUF4115 domain-containing protein [Alphaproteobacteria bacterium]
MTFIQRIKTPFAETRAEEHIPYQPGMRRIGELLQERREELGLDLNEIGAMLRIKPGYLAALEQGLSHNLPGPAYAIGFVRAYADFLGFDSRQVLERFKAEGAGVTAKPDLALPVPLGERSLPGGALVVAALILALCGYGFWYYRSTEERDRPARVAAVPAALQPPAAVPALVPPPRPGEIAPPAAAATPAAAAPAAPPSTAGPSAVPSPTTALAPAATPPAASGAMPPSAAAAAQAAPVGPQPAPTAASAPSARPMTPGAAVDPARTAAPPVAAGGTAAPPPQAAAVPVAPPVGARQTAAAPAGPAAAAGAPPAVGPNAKIAIRAVADCWIQVRAPDQSIVFSRVLKSGETYTVPARAGLSLRTGNAGALEIAVDGKPVPAIGGIGTLRRDVVLDPAELAAGSAVHG